MKKVLFTILALLLPMLISARVPEGAVQINGLWFDCFDTFGEGTCRFTCDIEGDDISTQYSTYTGDIVIPSTIRYNEKTYTVTTLGANVFWNSRGVTSLYIPNTITIIEDLYGNNLSTMKGVMCNIDNANNIKCGPSHPGTIISTSNNNLSKLGNYPDDCVLIVPAGSGSSYTNNGWGTVFKDGIYENAVIWATDKTMTYGDALPTLTYTVYTLEPIANDPELYCPVSSLTDVGTYPIYITNKTEVIASGFVTFDDSKGYLTITKAPLTVTAKNYTIKQGDPLPTFECTYSGFKNGETSSVLTTQPTISCSATTTNIPGEYDIIVSGANAKNYSFNYIKGKLTIVQRIYATGISLDQTSLTLTETGQTATLTATIVPDEATNKDVTWSSSNAAVATVSSTGVVTAVSSGTAVITATTADGTNLTAECNITVNIPVPATGISLNQTSLTLTAAGQTATLTATVTPSNATNKDVTWSSSNAAVATVSSTGVVTAVSSGTAVITAKTADGTNLTAECNVTVNIPVPATGISLNQTSLTLTMPGQTETLTATVTPSNATNKSVTWTSSNTEVATVSSTGVVAAVASGTAVVTATTADGTNLTAECNVTVNIPIIFADATVKTICVANWDTDGDGELSKTEAAAVTDLSTVFKNNTAITSFNELQYFTGLKNISSEAFLGCSGLKSLTFPSSLTRINQRAFMNCSGLTSLTIPNSVTYIASNPFLGCSGLTNITVESGNTRYDSRNNCNAIIQTASNTLITGCKTTIIPNSVTRIGFEAFRGCSGLTSLTIPNSVTSIDALAFLGCSSLTSITIPNSVTRIAGGALSNTAWWNNQPDGLVYAGKVAYEYKGTMPSNTRITLRDGTVSISELAFSGCTDLRGIAIPNSVTNIGEGAFEGTTWFNNQPNGLVYAGNVAYKYKGTMPSNTSITFREGTVGVADVAFDQCSNLTSVTIPNSVISIGEYAFQFCSGLTSVIIGNSVSNIDECAFTGCNALKSVKVERKTPCSINSDPFPNRASVTLYVPIGCKTIYEAANYWNGFKDIVEVAKDMNSSDISIVQIAAVTYTGLAQTPDITVKDGNTTLTSGTDYTVSYCDNTNAGTAAVMITGMGDYMGTKTANFTINKASLIITAKDYTIMQGDPLPTFEATYTGFKNNETFSVLTQQPTFTCNATSSNTLGTYPITVSNATAQNYAISYVDGTLTVVPPTIVFADAKVKAICVAKWDTNGDGELNKAEAAAVTSIGGFNNNADITSFNELQYFTGLTSIGSSVFSGCSGLTSVIIPNSVTSIGENAFADCISLTSVTIPNSVTSISYSSFLNCSGLTSIELHCTTVGSWFNGNSSIKIVTIGNEVTSIGDYAFRNCSGLTSIIIPNSVTSIGSSAFEGCSGLISITIPNSMTSIGNSVFENCSGLTSVTIPNSVTSIGDYAFRYCSGLTSITIPNSVTSIGQNAFSKSGLTSIIIPNSMTSIGNSAFSGCSCLTSVEIPSSVTSIGTYAFQSCSGLTSITIPSSVTSIGNSAFWGCSGLTSVEIPNSVTSISDYVFRSCSGLTSVTIPSSVTTIGKSAFSYSGLTSITIPNSVTTLGESAFNNCSGLTSVTIPRSVTTIGNLAFSGCSNLTKVKAEHETPISISGWTFSNNANATLYVPKDCKSSYKSETGWRNFGNIKEYPDGDVNEDGETDVVDVVDIARFVVGTPAASFVEFLADLDSNGEVGVADAIVLVNEIAGETNFARGRSATSTNLAADNVLSLNCNDNYLSLQMEGDGRYAALQFDLWMSSDIDIMQLSLNDKRRKGHQLLYNKVGNGHYRVVVLSTSGNAFIGTSGELLNIVLDGFDTDGIVVDNIHFVTPQGTDVPFEAISMSKDGATTSISHTPADTIRQQKVYNLNGQRMAAPHKGLNIIDGKKVMIK